MSNVNANFQAWDLQWKSYTTRNILLTIRQIGLIRKKKFAVAALDPEYKTFVVYVAALNINLGNEVHLLKRAQIAHLKINKTFTQIFSKYTNFADVFLSKLAVKFLKHIKINDYAIKLVDD